MSGIVDGICALPSLAIYSLREWWLHVNSPGVLYLSTQYLSTGVPQAGWLNSRKVFFSYSPGSQIGLPPLWLAVGWLLRASLGLSVAVCPNRLRTPVSDHDSFYFIHLTCITGENGILFAFLN